MPSISDPSDAVIEQYRLVKGPPAPGDDRAGAGGIGGFGDRAEG